MPGFVDVPLNCGRRDELAPQTHPELLRNQARFPIWTTPSPEPAARC